MREVFPDRAAWLAGRTEGIGASEIASVIGCGFKSGIQLWKEKTGMIKPKDISDDERVRFGNEAEDALRTMFRLIHPEYELSFTPYMVLRAAGSYSFLSCTPDGELVERETGKRGLYESKTATCMSKADWQKWWEKVPDAYLYQVCQGMFCGDYDFAIIWALIMDKEHDASLRMYRFEREDCFWQIEEIKQKGKAFWESVKSGTIPPIKL